MRSPSRFLALMFLGMSFGVSSWAHNFPIYPVEVELIVRPDHIQAKMNANASYWFGGILESNFAEGEWPEALQKKAKTYIDSHFLLEADGQPLESRLTLARHTQEPWQNGMESSVAYELTYALPANAKVLSGRATFFDEWKKHMQGSGQLHGDPSIPQTWLTTIHIPSEKQQQFTLTLEQPDFQIPVAEAFESDFHRWKVKLFAGLNSPLTLVILAILGIAVYIFRSKLKSMILFGVFCLTFASFADAHNVPYSYLELHLGPTGADGILTVHSQNWGSQLNLSPDIDLLDQGELDKAEAALIEEFRQKLTFQSDGKQFMPEHIQVNAVPKDLNLTVGFHLAWAKMPGVLTITRNLFAYDPKHQTMVSIYEMNRMAYQEFLKPGQNSLEYFSGTSQGKWIVAKKFIRQGVWHIFIGPDHILFIIGLLLFGGTIKRLLTIVTSFTLAHSITLGLAALKIFSPSARLVDCLVALSIVYIGVENLLAKSSHRDIRARISFCFGLIHGFGFAVTLEEFGLPPQALITSLFSFNLGVEIAQACIILLVAPMLGFIRLQNERLSRRIVTVGSGGIVLAGVYWFTQRAFLGG